MELVCVSCKKQLRHETEDGPKIEGYYLFSDMAYCIDCWKSGKSGEPVSCPISEPEIAA